MPARQSENGCGTRSMDLTSQHISAGKRRYRCLNDGKSIVTNAHVRIYKCCIFNNNDKIKMIKRTKVCRYIQNENWAIIKLYEM